MERKFRVLALDPGEEVVFLQEKAGCPIVFTSYGEPTEYDTVEEAEAALGHWMVRWGTVMDGYGWKDFWIAGSKVVWERIDS